MKIKELHLDEGILDRVKSAYKSATQPLRNIATSAVGTPLEIATQQAKYELIKNLQLKIQQQLDSGLVDLNIPAVQTSKPSTPERSSDLRQLVIQKVRDLKTQGNNQKANSKTIKSIVNTFAAEKNKGNPDWEKRLPAVKSIISRSSLNDVTKQELIHALTTGSTVKENKHHFDTLNTLFESIVEATGTNPISLYSYLKQYTASLLPGITEEELNQLKPILLQMQKSWGEKSEWNAVVNKWADMIHSLISNRRMRRLSGNTGTTDTARIASTTTSTQNPQQQYTDTLSKQIERMTTEYKDDIPKIIDTLMTRLQQIDPNGFKALVDKVKALPAGGSPATTTESKRPRRKA